MGVFRFLISRGTARGLNQSRYGNSASFYLKVAQYSFLNELILNFLKALEAGKLTSFFIPSFNLFQDKDLGTAIKRVKNLISAIETKPDSCLPPARAPCVPSDAPSKKIPFIVTNKIPTTEIKKKLPSTGKNKPLIKKLRLHR